MLEQHRERIRNERLVEKIKEIQNDESTLTNKFFKKHREPSKKRAVFKEATKHVLETPCINDNYFGGELRKSDVDKAIVEQAIRIMEEEKLREQASPHQSEHFSCCSHSEDTPNPDPYVEPTQFASNDVQS